MTPAGSDSQAEDTEMWPTSRVIDNAIYVDGVPSGAPANLDETYE